MIDIMIDALYQRILQKEVVLEELPQEIQATLLDKYPNIRYNEIEEVNIDV